MYDLQQFTLRDMAECGLALRNLGTKANSMEDAGNQIIQYLYQHLIDQTTGENACVLIRLFKTHSYGNLPTDLQTYVQSISQEKILSANLKCLTLLATLGELPAWNSRHQSAKHQAIPLLDEAAISRIPMISQLIKQLGLDIGNLISPDPNLITDLEQKMYNVFYIPDALNSPYIPDQKSFVIPFNVKSVLGFGGLLPSGNMFAIIMFLKVKVSYSIVNLLRPLALNIKMCILPFDDEKIFNNEQSSVSHHKSIIRINDDKLQRLNSTIATLTQLLDVSEQSAIIQSDRLEKTNTNLLQTLDTLQKTQTQLVNTEKMSSLGQLVAGIAHEINNPVNFISGNLTYVKEYTETLLQIIQTYQENILNPPPAVQELLAENEINFLIQDLNKIIDSMAVGTERISKIVQSLRTFSRLHEAEIKKIDIHESLNSTLLLLDCYLQARPEQPEIKIIKEYGELPLVECYPCELNQVFMNILNNAIDSLSESHALWAMTNQGEKNNYSLPTICIHTKLIDDQWVMISIADNGVGINEQANSKLFDPFFTTKPIGKGTGMGLSISYQIIVEKHRGDISFKSIPGQGAEFMIKIPVEMQN
ncbi:sensor histidine kinase [Nostoc sp. FACHB-110]|uniref:sensor histidine kinase n=1 Tax=Nostoc sp. FACHB-110 TaxID=2692834 RepID=UPI0016897F5A|nr:ATP-binding protein [Nostoc sp. FACHB-110]MBD2438413.1 HAMP domain-containing histidine kinase [Nostoc sp. FACHB-110]